MYVKKPFQVLGFNKGPSEDWIWSPAWWTSSWHWLLWQCTCEYPWTQASSAEGHLSTQVKEASSPCPRGENLWCPSPRFPNQDQPGTAFGKFYFTASPNPKNWKLSGQEPMLAYHGQVLETLDQPIKYHLSSTSWYRFICLHMYVNLIYIYSYTNMYVCNCMYVTVGM